MVAILKFTIILSLNVCFVCEVRRDNEAYAGAWSLGSHMAIPHRLLPLLGRVLSCLFPDFWCSMQCPSASSISSLWLCHSLPQLECGCGLRESWDHLGGEQGSIWQHHRTFVRRIGGSLLPTPTTGTHNVIITGSSCQAEGYPS